MDSPTTKLLGREASLATQVKQQWQGPGNILDVLLLVGGDVVSAAIAQLSGTRFPTPVVFSFGWITYIFTALVAIMGDGSLLPNADVRCFVVSVGGFIFDNESWIIGRLLRDFENGYWMPPEVKAAVRERSVRPEIETSGESSTKELRGLTITFFEASERRTQGVARPGRTFFLGIVVALVQSLIAAIPWILHGGSNYLIFVICMAGQVLAFTTASMPKYKQEKFGGRKGNRQPVMVTRGNGAHHVLCFLKSENGIDLRDLAVASRRGDAASPLLRMAFVTLAVLWVGLLITVDGMTSNTWYLVAVGGIGSIYSVFAASTQQSPVERGLPFDYVKCISEAKVMDALMQAEMFRPRVGDALLSIFFPGELQDAEQQFWETARETNRRHKARFQDMKTLYDQEVERIAKLEPGSHLDTR